jgi:hypothetical protein
LGIAATQSDILTKALSENVPDGGALGKQVISLEATAP